MSVSLKNALMMYPQFNSILCILLLIVWMPGITACSKNVHKILKSKKLQERGLDTTLLLTKDTTLQYDSLKGNQITLKYLGCGGFYMGNSQNAILIDPFFSHASLLNIPFKIGTDSSDVKFGLDDIKSDLRQNTNGIFVAHSHYDHLMDAPYVFNHYLNPSKSDVQIYGTQSMANLLSFVIAPQHIEIVENNLSDQDNTKSWISVGDGSIRVLPILSGHAPHTKFFGLNILFFKGCAKRIPKYTSDTTKMAGWRWKGGKTLSFLVDFLSEDKVAFRIYIHSSASKPPSGFFSKDLLKEHEVDLAILGAASFDNILDYPESIIEHIDPEKIIICHWEDFFKPYQKYPKRFIRATNFKKFIPRLDEKFSWKSESGEQRVFFPEPRVSLIIKK